MPTCGQEMPISKPHNCFISGLNYFLKCELNFGNFRKPFTSYLPSPTSVALPPHRQWNFWVKSGRGCLRCCDSLRLSGALLLIKPETTQVGQSVDSSESKWGWLQEIERCLRGEGKSGRREISHSEKSLRWLLFKMTRANLRNFNCFGRREAEDEKEMRSGKGRGKEEGMGTGRL